ncbi:MAG TPA: penicillin acylase family protein [Nocardioidaceae bacterium]|nr:penicillin acylase family protein [Nocardioidaceae bacterium]
MRRVLAATALTAAAVLAASTVAGPTAAGVAAPDPYGTVRNILPPGQSGTVTATDFLKVMAGDPQGRVAVEGENAPENFADQLEMYDAINTVAPGSIRATDLDRFYKDAGFTPNEVVRSAEPRPGVTIEWDEFGVPYITGDTDADTAFGAGYAATQDRMFLMDVLRHAGRARLAEFAGATESNLAMDQTQLRSAFYTEAEAQAQIGNAAAEVGGELGERGLRSADAFIAGINAAQEEMCPAVAAPSCPVEYAALQKQPRDWTRADVTYVASLVGGIFGKGGGDEFANAIWLQRLQARFGPVRGRRIYTDLRSKNDTEAPTTSSVRTPYGGGRVDETKSGVALPDLDGPTAPGTGDPVSAGSPVPGLSELPTGLEQLRGPGQARLLSIELPRGSIDLPLVPGGMSNALLVGADETRSGHPVAVFGPQTGYFTPQLLTEQVLVGPHIKARGVSFAGTNLIVQLGRGVDYAWSATSASNDNVDTVVERLCEPDGSRPTVESEHYLRAGDCVPMDRFVHRETAVPNVAAPGPPQTYEFLVLRTHHGIVQTRTTVDGTPVAVALQRSTYHHEVDSVLGFARLNDPGFVNDAESFEDAVSAIDYTFNWFYADDRDIAYFSSGRLPLRDADVDFDLPRWGDATFDWQGWLPQERHPQQVNPPSGHLVSWNNKTAPGFSAADGVYGYGPVYRSLALSDRIERATGGDRTVTLPQVAGIVQDAATVDSRARHTLPLLLRVIGDDRRTSAARGLLRAWLADGAHRVDRDRDGRYAHEQAIALFDAWWEDGDHSVAYDVLAGRLGDRLVRRLPEGLDDHPRLGLGSAWNNVGWYGYVSKDLRSVLGRTVGSPYSTGYCGGGDLGPCRRSLRTSLRAAAARVTAEQGVSSVTRLGYDKSEDYIRSTTAGTVGVRPLDWQNRPTFQQVVAFLGHRPR